MLKATTIISGVLSLAFTVLFVYFIINAVTGLDDNCPNGLAQCAGEAVGDFKKGMDKVENNGLE